MVTLPHNLQSVTFPWDIARYAVAAGLLTAGEHLALRDLDELKIEERYVLGTLTIWVCFALWAHRRREYVALGAISAITVAAGITPALGHRLRRTAADATIRELRRRYGTPER